jgi:hypothetical protein
VREFGYNLIDDDGEMYFLMHKKIMRYRLKKYKKSRSKRMKFESWYRVSRITGRNYNQEVLLIDV